MVISNIPPAIHTSTSVAGFESGSGPAQVSDKPL